MSRDWLLPLVPLYAAGAAAKNLAYDRNWVEPHRLRWPVVSVGNLSVGGAGKTPLVIRLAELLARDGLTVDVLSRGYGRGSRAVEAVDAAGSARQFGDEPLLIAQRTGVPVVLGADRYAAGLLAERSLGSDARALHLLDDGFQHRRLARNVDVVVVHASDLDEKLLPAGRLREPISSLKRATIVVLREEDLDVEERLRRLGIVAPIWRMHRTIEVPPQIGKAVAFCGIARAQEFFGSLAASGVSLVATRAFTDHHRYTQRDVAALLSSARAAGAQAFVTTEKDTVKLDPGLREQLERGFPLQIVRLTVTLQNEAAIVEDLRGRIAGGVQAIRDVPVRK
jgi:tetraacyldisaccharide 4'-kinase